MEWHRESLKNNLWDEIFFAGKTDQKRGVPHPPVQKEYPKGAKLLDLVGPESFTVGQVSIREVIKKRRSHREFSKDPLNLEELSFMLWAAQGIHEIWKRGSATRRTVPSAGSRHAFELYVIINRVAGIAPGVYRYLAVEHKLQLIAEGEYGEQLGVDCRDQKFVGQSAVSFIWTVVPYRAEWRYDKLAYKMLAIDVGHSCENLYLASESINAGTCAVGAYYQDRIDSLLRVDGEDEFAIYVAAVGHI